MQLSNNNKMNQSMKPEISMKWLSQIVQQSYKDDLDNTRQQLAKLANQQFLIHYMELNHGVSLHQNYKHLLAPPHCPNYVKFIPKNSDRETAFRHEIKKTIQRERPNHTVSFTKEQLKAMVIKQRESAEKERLSTSRKEKRDNYYDKLRSSRKQQYQQSPKAEVTQISPVKSVMSVTTEESIDDIFLRLQVVGEGRDLMKKRWYGWGENGSAGERRKIIGDWNKNHNLMKELLQKLLEKLNKEIGMMEVFKQLKIGDSSSVLNGLRTKNSLKSQKDLSLGSTRIDRELSKQQLRMVYRFGAWFNKLLLDQRQLQYIETHLPI